MKENLSKMFEVQCDLISFTYPLVKSIVCLAIILFCIMRDRIICISNVWINSLITVVCLVLTIACILCLYISIGEMFHTYANRKRLHSKAQSMMLFLIDDVVKMVLLNDLIEIEVFKEKSVVKIGVGSCCKYDSFAFYAKEYYVGRTKHNTIEEFESSLRDIFPNGFVPILAIDGLPPRKYFR